MSCLKVYFLDPGSIFKMKAGTGPFEEGRKKQTKKTKAFTDISG